MNDLNNITYVFSRTTLLEALKEWEQEQLKNYPHQKERIQTTVVAMQHFMLSPQVVEHKMIVSGNPDEFDIVMPSSLEDLEKPE